MKKKLLVIFLVVCVGVASLAWAGLLQQRLKVVLARKNAPPPAPSDFVFTVTVTGPDTFTVPIYNGGTYDFEIDCAGGTGGGTVTAFDDGDRVCSYAGGGTYTITIAAGGTLIGWRFDDSGDKLLIRDIQSWGPLRLGNNGAYFHGCSNLTISATDVLDLTGTTTLFEMFNGCSSLTTVSSMDAWDVSSVTILVEMFKAATNFNQNLDSWDVSSVTDMRGVFLDSSLFNGNITSWDVANVTTMQSMFQNAVLFNQDIGGWDVAANLAVVYGMFSGATAFNQDIGSWNSISSSNPEYVFSGASSFNQDISGWDMSGVATMQSFLQNAVSFDQDLGIWDIANVTDAANFLAGVTLSTSNYDSLLIGWEANAHQNNVTFHGGGSKYSAGAAATAKAALETDGWTITDGGQE